MLGLVKGVPQGRVVDHHRHSRGDAHRYPAGRDLVPLMANSRCQRWMSTSWRRFTGFKTATVEELPEAVEVMDRSLRRLDRRRTRPVPPPRPAGHLRAPWPQERPALPPRAGPCTRAPICSPQAERPALCPVRPVIHGHAHVEVGATGGICQRMIAAYRQEYKRRGRELMVKLIESISHRVPNALREIIPLGRTLKKGAADVLAYFDRPGTSNGPAEAINGRLEHLRGSALVFRNRTELHRQIAARDRRVLSASKRNSSSRRSRNLSQSNRDSRIPTSIGRPIAWKSATVHSA